jgi:surfactin synthase thioesterase subunit
MTFESHPWLLLRPGRPKALLRLFCLPYAGGGSSAYRDWQSGFPSEIEVCPVQLPGRENRFSEPPATSMPSLVRALAAGLRPFLDRPFALFGHSLGALVAFELCQELRSMGQPVANHLFASARRAPHLPDRRPPIHHLPDEAFVAELRRLNGTPEEVLGDSDLMELILPTLRADFTIAETYRWKQRPPLDCPITVFAGRDDPETTPAEVEGWRTHTRGALRVELLPGDHFFVYHSRSQLQAAILRELMAPRLDEHQPTVLPRPDPR